MVDTRPRIGVYGGSFDPIHQGHLTVAQAAFKAFALQHLYFIPVGQSPLKTHRPYASDKDRLCMLALALQKLGPSYSVLTTDLNRPGPSYTLDTVQQLQTQFPLAQFFWIMGQDQLAKLAYWHEVHQLVLQLEFIVYKRCLNAPFKMPDLDGLRVHFLEALPVDISSTDVRLQLAKSKFCTKGLPKSVFQFIQTNKLYGYKPN